MPFQITANAASPPISAAQLRVEPRLVARSKTRETHAGEFADHALDQEGVLHVEFFVQERIEKTDAMLSVNARLMRTICLS